MAGRYFTKESEASRSPCSLHDLLDGELLKKPDRFYDCFSSFEDLRHIWENAEAYRTN